MSKTWGLIAGLVAAGIWGGMYVVSKVVLEVIPPFTLLSLRLVLAILALGAAWLWRGGGKVSRGQLAAALAAGLVGYGVSLGLQFVGTRLSTAANGAVITSSTPAFVFLFAALLLREQISKRRAFALALATLGVLAVIDPRAARLSPDLFLGNLALAAAGFTWALYSVLVRKTTQSMDALSFTLIAFFGGLAVSLPGAALEIGQASLGRITPGLVAGVLYLGLVSTALAAYLWNKSFEVLEAGVASLTFFAQPVVGAGLGALFLDERLTPLFLLGGMLIGLGLWLAASDSRPKIKQEIIQTEH